MTLPEPGALHIQFPPILIPLTPLDVVIEPYWYLEIARAPVPAPQRIAGRLLTPAEGCGFSALGNNKIVGGGPAKNGKFDFVALKIEMLAREKKINEI